MSKIAIRIVSLIVAVFLGLLLSQEQTLGAPEPKTYTFKAVTFVPVSNPNVKNFRQWSEEVQKASNGQIVVKLLGGPEVVPMFDQHDAVGKGVVDLNFTSSGYYLKQLPEARCLTISTLTPQQERKVGFLDFMRELHAKKKNVFVIGRQIISDLEQFVLWTNIEVKNIQTDLKGAKFRTSGSTYVELYKSLGVSGITMRWSDVYTAVERGLIQGFSVPVSRFAAEKYYEVVKYGISPGFWSNNSVLLMNLDKWNSLPKNLQQIMLDVQERLEPEFRAYVDSVDANAYKAVKQGGAKIIKLPPDQAKWLTDAAYDGLWQLVKAGASPENYAKLRKMLLGE